MTVVALTAAVLLLQGPADSQAPADGKAPPKGAPKGGKGKGKGGVGGQYGVSIAETSGAAIGTYRYLLFDMSRTEDADPFGNTFFSEFTVIEKK